MPQTYEVEIKSLLGSKENADSLKKKILEKGGVLIPEKTSKQLNHYFIADDYSKLKDVMDEYIPADRKEVFHRAIDEGRGTSVRTRQTKDKVIFVIKASVNDHSSSNGTSRIEFEETVPLTLDELDNLLISAGLSYQAKWSREREEYKMDDVNISIDKNAGYGYLAEFERITDVESELEEIKKSLLDVMGAFGVEELSQDRLERMFDFYNKNWRDFYGTEKVFNIE